MSFLGHLAKAVDLKNPAGSSKDIGDSHAETPLPATLVRIPAEPQEKTDEWSTIGAQGQVLLGLHPLLSVVS